MAKKLTGDQILDVMWANCMDLRCNTDVGDYPAWTCTAYGIVSADGYNAEDAVKAVLKKIHALEKEGRDLREERDQMEYSRLKRKYGEYV